MTLISVVGSVRKHRREGEDGEQRAGHHTHASGDRGRQSLWQERPVGILGLGKWRASVWGLKAQSTSTVTVTSNTDKGMTLLVLWGC